MPNYNIRTSTGKLPRRVLTSRRTAQRAAVGKVMTVTAFGKFLTPHAYRCLEIMGMDLKMLFDLQGISKRVAKTVADIKAKNAPAAETVNAPHVSIEHDTAAGSVEHATAIEEVTVSSGQ